MARNRVFTMAVVVASLIVGSATVSAQSRNVWSNTGTQLTGPAEESNQEMSLGAGARYRDALVGSWVETVVVTGGPTFKSLVTYARDGARISSDQGSVITEPPFPHQFSDGHGPWTHRSGRVFTSTFQQIVSDLNGGLLFVNTVRETITVSPSRNSYQSVWRAEFVDANGVVAAAFEGTSEAQRIPLEPLP